MFDEVTRTERGRHAARRASYVLGSTFFQVLVVVAFVAASAALRATVVREAVVDVKFVRVAAPPPPPPAPPAPPPAARRRPPPQKPRTDLQRPPPPQALIQPKEVAPEMKPPDPNEPPEPEYASDDRGEGVIGGVVGAPPRPPQVEEAPAYATTGYRKPQTSVPGCVQRSLHLPPELLDSVEGTITVKFAVGRDGAPSRFEVVTGVHDQRIVSAVWGAVQSCRWIPGADAQGRPVSIWVVMPVRFAF